MEIARQLLVRRPSLWLPPRNLSKANKPATRVGLQVKSRLWLHPILPRRRRRKLPSANRELPGPSPSLLVLPSHRRLLPRPSQATNLTTDYLTRCKSGKETSLSRPMHRFEKLQKQQPLPVATLASAWEIQENKILRVSTGSV